MDYLKETAASTPTEAKTPDVGYSDWWRVFKDPVLGDLEKQVASANLDLINSVFAHNLAKLNLARAQGAAADSLQQMGYTNVASMDGGIRSWREKGFPLVVG